MAENNQGNQESADPGNSNTVQQVNSSSSLAGKTPAEQRQSRWHRRPGRSGVR